MKSTTKISTYFQIVLTLEVKYSDLLFIYFLPDYGEPILKQTTLF